jgi:hypothetical protein
MVTIVLPKCADQLDEMGNGANRPLTLVQWKIIDRVHIDWTLTGRG